MSTAPDSNASLLAAVITQVCPVAPPGAQQYADQLMGYLLWGVGILFILGVIVGIAAIVGGRVFSMPHASKAGVVGVVLVFVAIIAYLVLPGIVRAMTGSGCV
jgi:ABC-type dipeptide/oligopeptide/nickel transport system permease subunit